MSNLNIWLTGKQSYRLQRIEVSLISDDLDNIKSQIPVEIASKSQLLKNLDKWINN